MVTANAPGAIHTPGSDIPCYTDDISLYMSQFYPDKTDTWFSIEPDASFVDAKAVANSRFHIYTTDYFLNDQTFAYINFGDTNFTQKNNFTSFAGSYLTDWGVFVGLSNYSINSKNMTFLAPGYRYNLPGNGYLAFSVDYALADELAGIFGLDLDGKYYTAKMKIIGQIYAVTVSDGALLLDLKANYKLNDAIVAGAGFGLFSDETSFQLGCTWKTTQFTTDIKCGKFGPLEAGYGNLSGMYKLNANTSFGLQCDKNGKQDPVITIKGKYLLTDARLLFGCSFANSDTDASIYLTYQKSH